MTDTRLSVTAVIATYRRVDALTTTLRSLQLQEHTNWNAIVVGDNCEHETADAINSLAEARISYYNLPKRYGEQSGPNSFGLALAKGKFVTFLNHDDMLLQDHFHYGLKMLRSTKSDFFIGRCANAEGLTTASDGSIMPTFPMTLPTCRDLSFLITEDAMLFDPSSFWIVRTSYARNVGQWLPARQLYRTPLRNWLMRAWRQGGKFIFGGRITGLRFWTQNLRWQGSPLYSHDSPEHSTIASLLESCAPDELRKIIGWSTKKSNAVLAQYASQAQHAPLSRKDRYAAALYRATGIDLYSLYCRWRGAPHADELNRLSAKRTGKVLPPLWDLTEVLADPESCRII